MRFGEKWLVLILILRSGLTGCVADVEPADGAVFPGLRGQVEVTRDELGVPHIRAQSISDAYFASGYLQARDRGTRMEAIRRRARGTQAAVLGASKVDDDVMMRTLGLMQLGAHNAELLRERQPAAFELLVAWTAGVNRALLEQREGAIDPLLARSEDWSVSDVLAVERLVLFGNGNVLAQEVLASYARLLLPSLVPDTALFAPFTEAPLVTPEDASNASALIGGSANPTPNHSFSDALPIDGSTKDRLERALRSFARLRVGATNAIALGRDRSSNDRPLLASDPHQEPTVPSAFWFQHISVPSSDLDVFGACFTGTPGVQIGMNTRLAWFGTTSFQDTMDMWTVPREGDEVRIGDEPLALETRLETIEIADGDPMTIEVARVPGYGVLLPISMFPIPLRGNDRVLLRWTGFEPGAAFDSYRRMNEARDVEAFSAAISTMDVGSFNWVFADENRIGYRSTGRVPERGPDARDPWQVMDGRDRDAFWVRPFSDRELPSGGDRADDFYAAANQHPLGVDDTFGVFFDPGMRAARLRELVVGSSWTAAGLGQVLLDDLSPIARSTLPVIGDVIARVDDEHLLGSPDELRALARELVTWDARMSADSHEALVFAIWINLFARELLANTFGVLFQPLIEAQPVFLLQLAAQLANGRNRAELLVNVTGGLSGALVRALAATSRELTEHPEWTTWGDVHHEVLLDAEGRTGHDFGAASGFDDTVRMSGSRYLARIDDGDAFRPVEGSSWRMTVEFDSKGRPIPGLVIPASNDANVPRSEWLDSETRMIDLIAPAGRRSALQMGTGAGQSIDY